MTISNLLEGCPSWLSGGSEEDVVLSCRVRLARNVFGVPFPAQADDRALANVLDVAKNSVKSLNEHFGEDFLWIDLEKIEEVDRMVLVEKHLISPLQASKSKMRAVIVNKNASISIMVNEEDHFRIQVMKPGLDLENVFKLADEIDDVLEENIDFAFDEKFGYLTACPTNMGTALRATAMLHMPGLVLSHQVENMARAAAQVGLIVRGMYGEGSDVLGDVFQVSNQLAMGYGERELIDSMADMVKQIAAQERLARKHLFEKNRVVIEDKIWRAYGLLNYVRILENNEAMSLYSMALLGINLGILNIPKRIFYELMIGTRPNHILSLMTKIDNRYTSEELRAAIVREKLSEVAI